jgi:DNA-binding PadR family transcriptional regulator
MPVLNNTQGLALGLLMQGPASPGELIQRADEQMAGFWTITRSGFYQQILTLVELGMVDVTSYRTRAIYEINTAGQAAFERWLTELPGQRRIVHDPIALQHALLYPADQPWLRRQYRAIQVRIAERIHNIT